MNDFVTIEATKVIAMAFKETFASKRGKLCQNKMLFEGFGIGA